MKKVLVTGANGLLGSKIVEKRGNYEIYPTHATYPLLSNSLKMNITNENEVNRVISKVEPDIVIHAAAETNVDKCESNKEYALNVNAEATEILAETCNQAGAKIVYVSTDYVFDGEKKLYVEEDEPSPVNYYGLTKLMGEKYVEDLCERFLILRTSVLYGTHARKSNFAKWVLEALIKGKPFTIVDDHYNSPTLADNLAEVILEMISREMVGLYHTAGCKRVSRYRFALMIAKTFNFDSTHIQPIKMSELKTWTAKRPKDSSLCVDKVKREIDTKLLDVTEGLKEMYRNWLKTK